jgi:hypothetical protein
VALCLTFIDDGGARLDTSRRVEIQAYPSDPLDGYGGQAGLWVELRDRDDRVVYRRILHDPGQTVEAPLEPSRGRLTRIDAPAVAFEARVILPELPAATRVVLMRSTAAGRPAEPMAVVNLTPPV